MSSARKFPSKTHETGGGEPDGGVDEEIALGNVDGGEGGGGGESAEDE